MCPDQKAFFASINSQLLLVRELVSDLTEDLGSINKVKRVCPYVSQMMANIEIILSEIEPFNDEILEDCDVPDNWEERLANRTYSEIVGLDETDIQASSLEPFMDERKSPPDEPQSFSLKDQTMARGPYRSYNTIEKLNVVRLHKEGRSYASISKFLKIPQKNIVRWCKNGIYRKEGAGRKIGDEFMQKKLVEWIQKQYLEGNQVSGKQIRNKAMEYSNKTEFKSSKGWLKNFMRRHNNLTDYVNV